MISKLLILEEKDSWSEILTSNLSETNFRFALYRASTREECLETLSDQSIDVILLNINPGDTSGFNLLKELTKIFPDIPFIVLSTQNNDVIGIQAIRAGAQDFIPLVELDARRLSRSIRYAMLRSKSQSQLREEVRELARNKKYFLEVQKLAKFGNWEMDIVTNAMKWSDEVFRIFGFTPNSISPSLSNYLDSVHPLDKERVDTFFEETTRDGKVHRMQHRILVAGKTIKTIALQAKVNYDETEQKIVLIGGLQDISDLRFISLESF